MTNPTHSRTSKPHSCGTEAPNVFLTPISFVRRRVE